MKKVQNIIIGFGKAGKTLAVALGKRGESTILIERDPKMYGGTCINVACIPTKKLVELAAAKPTEADAAIYYQSAIAEKNKLIASLNEANYQNVHQTENVEVVDGRASFVSDTEIRVEKPSGAEEFYGAERIFINTGSRPNVPNIEGLVIDGQRLHTSETLIQDEELPARLTIIGAGYIGLEFASIYSQFGARVQVVSNDTRERFLKTLDNSIAELVLERLEELGIEFIFEADTKKLTQSDASLTLTYEQASEIKMLETDKILVATGRHANIQSLNLAAAGIILNEDETIQVNKHLQTNKRHIYALGDVKGGPQHTYISLDDYRVVKSKLFEDGDYNLSNRKAIPTTMFIDPPLSYVGFSEEIARGNGHEVAIAKIAVKSIPRAKIMNKTTGVYKAVVDAETNLILGVLLFGEDSHEVINIVSTAINAELPYTSLAEQIYTHPTMAEALNDLFNDI